MFLLTSYDRTITLLLLLFRCAVITVDASFQIICNVYFVFIVYINSLKSSNTRAISVQILYTEHYLSDSLLTHTMII